MRSTAEYSVTAFRRISNPSQRQIGCMIRLLVRGLRAMGLGLVDHTIGLRTGSKASWTRFVSRFVQRQKVIGTKFGPPRFSCSAGMLEMVHTMLIKHGRK